MALHLLFTEWSHLHATLAVVDVTGWITAAVAIVALVLNMVAGAVRFEVRMTRVEERLVVLKTELDQVVKRMDKRRSTDFRNP